MWGEIGKALVQVVLPLAGTALAGAGTAVLKKQLSKVGLEVTAQQEQQLRQLVFDAVTRTEEVARRDPSMTGGEKAAYAEQTVLARMPDANIADVRHFIDVALPNLRSRGIGAAPKVVVAQAPGK